MDLLGLRAAWAKRPAFALRKLVAPFLVLLYPSSREPHHGLVARESLASLDSRSAEPAARFFLRMEGDRVALFEPGQASHSNLSFGEFEAIDTGQVLLAAPKE